MKIHAGRTDLLILVSLLGFILTTTILAVYPKVILQAMYCNWVYWIAIIIIFFTKARRLRLTSTAPNHIPIADNQSPPPPKTRTLVYRVILLQICLWGMYQSVISLLQHHSSATAPPLAAHFSLIYGLFPWATMLGIALSVAFTSFYQHKDAFTYTLVSPFIEIASPHTGLAMTINNVARLAMISVLAITLGLLTVHLADIFTSNPLIIGLHPDTLLIAILIFVGVVIANKRILTRLFQQQRWLPWAIALIMLAIAGLIIVLNALLMPLQHHTISAPFILKWIQRHNTNTLLDVFSVCWWLCWVPISAILIARWSYGYTVGAVILTVVLTTLTITLLIAALSPLMAYTLFAKHTHNFYTLSGILGWVASIIWLIILTQRKHIASLLHAYLPKNNIIKVRDHVFYFRRAVLLIALTLYLYLPANIYGILFFMVLGTIFYLPITLFIGIGLIKQLCTKRMQELTN